MRTARQKPETAAVVDEGLALLETTNRYLAAHFMAHYGVRFAVIVRVLCPPSR